jgi:hypothetical protein
VRDGARSLGRRDEINAHRKGGEQRSSVKSRKQPPLERSEHLYREDRGWWVTQGEHLYREDRGWWVLTMSITPCELDEEYVPPLDPSTAALLGEPVIAGAAPVQVRRIEAIP